MGAPAGMRAGGVRGNGGSSGPDRKHLNPG